MPLMQSQRGARVMLPNGTPDKDIRVGQPYMKVLHTVGSMDSQHSGVSVCVNNLTKALSDLGLQVSVFSLLEPHFSKDKGVEVLRFAPEILPNLSLRKLGQSRDLHLAVSRGGFPIVHTHGLWLGVNSYRDDAAKFVVSPHGMLSPVALRFSRLKKAFAFHFYQSKALNCADMFIATSLSEYEDIRRFGLRQPVALIPNGISVPAVDPSTKSEQDLVALSLGRIHPKKGLVNLVKAWAALGNRNSNWTLKIVGPDECNHSAELIKLVQSFGLSNVEILPAVYGDEKYSLLSQANLFVLPSLSENFALTVAESLAAGTPVIATKGSPWQGLETERCGWWIDVGAAPLVEALSIAMGMPECVRQDWGRRGQAWMSRDFTWGSVASQTTNAYAWLLGQRTRPDFVFID